MRKHETPSQPFRGLLPHEAAYTAIGRDKCCKQVTFEAQNCFRSDRWYSG